MKKTTIDQNIVNEGEEIDTNYNLNVTDYSSSIEYARAHGGTFREQDGNLLPVFTTHDH